MSTLRFFLACTGLLTAIGVIVRLFANGKIHFSQGAPVDTPLLTASVQVTGELLVSPYDTQREVINFLSQSKYTLQLRFYQITDNSIKQLLRNLSQLGVDIDMIVENNIYGSSAKDFTNLQTYLKGQPVEIRTDEHLGTNFVHAKTAIVDGSSFVISTANLSYPSFRQNREYRFISSHSGITQSLANIFAKDRTGATILSGDIHPLLLVCPVDCRSKIEQALQDAQNSIRIQAQYIEDSNVIEILSGKSQTIEDVRLLVGEYQGKERLDEFGTGVRIFDEFYLHAKNILIDDRILIMGSMNLSTNALDNNREFGIIIDDPRVIKQFKGQFERDWEKSMPWEQ